MTIFSKTPLSRIAVGERMTSQVEAIREGVSLVFKREECICEKNRHKLLIDVSLNCIILCGDAMARGIATRLGRRQESCDCIIFSEDDHFVVTLAEIGYPKKEKLTNKMIKSDNHAGDILVSFSICDPFYLPLLVTARHHQASKRFFHHRVRIGGRKRRIRIVKANNDKLKDQLQYARP